jgi:hypothetical protein
MAQKCVLWNALAVKCSLRSLRRNTGGGSLPRRFERRPGGALYFIGPSARCPRFSPDSALEGHGFEPVWGFSCQVVIFGLVGGSLFGAGKPFFVPSPAIRFAERAEGGQGTETVAKLGGLPLASLVFSQRLDT